MRTRISKTERRSWYAYRRCASRAHSLAQCVLVCVWLVSAFASRDHCLASHENDKNTLAALDFAIFSTSVLSFFPLAIFLLQSTLVNWFSSWVIGRGTLRCCRWAPRHCCWCCRRCCCCFFASSATAFVCVITYYCSIFEICRPFEMKMRDAEKGERERKRGTSNYCARIISWACRSQLASSGRILTTHNNGRAGRRHRRNFAAEIVFLQIFITFNRWRHFFFWFCGELVLLPRILCARPVLVFGVFHQQRCSMFASVVFGCFFCTFRSFLL